MLTDTIEIPRFMDFHAHFRTGPMLEDVVPQAAEFCAGAIAMPNVPAVLDGQTAAAYRKEIGRAAAGKDFKPLMTIQVTPDLTPKLVRAAHDQGVVACKVYPKGVTTASGHGLPAILLRDPTDSLLESFNEMSHLGMVLSLHGEMPGAFCLAREEEFLPVVGKLAYQFPGLKIVLEHISTEAAVAFVEAHASVAATVTPQHLRYTLDAVLGDGIDPYNLCMPLYKTPDDRRALHRAVCGGNRRFFAGTDTAPHLEQRKACMTGPEQVGGGGCAGVFVPPRVALAVYAEILARGSALLSLADFTSRRGCDWYGMEPPPLSRAGTFCGLTVSRREWTVPFRTYGVVPLLRGETLAWDVRAPK